MLSLVKHKNLVDFSIYAYHANYIIYIYFDLFFA